MPKLELSVMAELGTLILSLHGAASNWGAGNPQSPSKDTQRVLCRVKPGEQVGSLVSVMTARRSAPTSRKVGHI